MTPSQDKTRQAIVTVMSINNGSIAAEDLLACFKHQLKPSGVINRCAYFEFVSIVESVAIKHESETFGPTWILRKPPSRLPGL